MCHDQNKWDIFPTQAKLDAQWQALVAFHMYKQQLFTNVQEEAPKRCTSSY